MSSEEPRRKRKWDNQGEDDAAIKKAASEVDVQGKADTSGFEASHNPDSQTGPSEQSDGDAASAAAAAAIAAAKLNAMLVAQANAAADGNTTADSSAPNEDDPSGNARSNGVVPIREGKERDEFVADIDINDVKHRYVLTKGSTQTQLQRETGADVTTRGKYYTDRSEATERDPPLYLHVTAVTQEALDLAVKKITEMIDQAQTQAPLPPQRESFQGAPPRSYGYGGPPRHQSFHARVPIGIESDRTFNVRAKIVGPSGQYVKHVQNETKTRVQLKGRGSGYLEVETGREAEEPLFINIIGNSQEDVDAAERLCKDLVETVRGEYERMRTRPPEPYSHNRHYSGRSYHNNGYNQRYQGGQHYQHNYNQQYQPPPPPGTAAPPVNPPLPPGPPPPPSSADPTTPTTPTSTTPAAPGAADAAAQGYSYEQYEAYNQYYYQQYYQQYGQYYQQYAQPGAEQGAEATSAAAVAAVAGETPVSSDPALAYYGYAYAPPPPPPAEQAAPGTSAEAAAPPPPPPP
ncbi:hypothetical protein B0O80DRAFT_404764, partial [Mortierella sp. GBAus27b]